MEFLWSEHLSVFNPNAGKCGLEELQIRTLFTQWGLKSDDSNKNFDPITSNFSNIVHKGATLKNKIFGGNHAQFIDKNVREIVYTRKDHEENMYSKLFWKNNM